MLIDKLDGTITQNRNDGSSLMWLKDAKTAGTKMTWTGAHVWITSLNSGNYFGYNNWRLPNTNPVNGASYDYSWSYDGSTDRGHNISASVSAYPGSTGSEMAYMFYEELGNLGYYDTDGSGPQLGWGLSNTGLFTNLEASVYWPGTEYTPSSSSVWGISFYYGSQDASNQNEVFNAWAVREMEVVPEPTTIALLDIGLAGLVGAEVRRRRKKKAVDKVR